MSKIEVRPMVVGDRASFAELTRHRPGYDAARAEARTDVIWHIAFENPSRGEQPTYFVATDGTRILCHMGRMPTIFWVSGKRVSAYFAHDLFAHPELQATGAGFFVTMKLYKTVEAACTNFVGLAWTNDINIKFQQARKYHQMWVRRWARPLDLDTQLSKMPLPGVARTIGKAFGGVALRALDGALGLGVARCERWDEPFDARFDVLAERVGSKLGITPDKTAPYLTWRYRSWPGLPTTTYVVNDPHGELAGFIVLRNGNAGDLGGLVLDISFDPNVAGTGVALVGAALEHFRKANLHGVWCTVSSPEIKRVLKRHLFVERPPDYPLFVMNSEKYEDPHLLRCLDAWHHVYGDSEGGEAD